MHPIRDSLPGQPHLPAAGNPCYNRWKCRLHAQRKKYSDVQLPIGTLTSPEALTRWVQSNIQEASRR